jgi:putative transposase
MNRGNGRRTVFHKDGDFDAFRKLLGEAAARTDMRLLAYCLRNNSKVSGPDSPENNRS